MTRSVAMKRSTFPVKALAFLATIVTAASPTQGAQLPAPIAPAAAGQLQCYSPDTTRKTCTSLASYKSRGNGRIDNTAVVLISRNPVLTMQTVSPVEIKTGKVCGKIRRQNIDAAKFAAVDHELDMKQAEPLRQQLKLAYKEIFDREICTAYVPDGGTLLAKATMDGAPMPAPDQRVMWVRPNEGYKVSP